MFRCKNCLNASTRPRIQFDSRGWCNACQWMEEKKSLNWNARESQLKNLLQRHRQKTFFDCVVTVSGGKDGSYVAHKLKNQYGMNPLCLTIRPPLSLSDGDRNLVSFIKSGYQHCHITTDMEAMRVLDTIGFVEFGQGYYGWLTAIHTAVLRTACYFGIGLIFYSEDGEIEYGGSTSNKNVAVYGIDYMKKAYLNNTYEQVIKNSNLSEKELFWFRFPKNLEKNIQAIDVTHMSYYENWDPYRNYLVAKEHCGFQEMEQSAVGTFTNFAQNDQELASLHYYLMYLKFGFGRATQDAGIEIRRGAMTRQQGVNLVKLYDNQPPLHGYKRFAEYFRMNESKFESVIDKFANQELFKKINGQWQPKFDVE